MSTSTYRRSLLLILVLLVCRSALPAFAQVEKLTDTRALRRISDRLDRVNIRERRVADSLSVLWKRPLVTRDSTGSILQLMRLSNGRPEFYITHNRSAALSIGTNAILPGGRSGLNLTAESILIGIWDGGGVRTDHIEFGGRVVQRDTVLQVLNHSTHVAGTLVASGSFDAARGMAPDARLDARDWNNDTAEMARAALNGLTLSNHSYGQPAGWVANVLGDNLWGWMGAPDVDSAEDFKFGYYSEVASDWDAIAEAAPRYLIVKSAGNERADTGARSGEPYYIFTDDWVLSTVPRSKDGGASGYDTVTDSGVAKNILTIGAVDDLPWGYSSPADVVMTDFSGWGPTDDGRIKPDLVSDGVQLMSSMAWAADAYGTSTGTSMATPTVTGSLALLSELFARTHAGGVPSASMLKALLIHTARESGPAPGPDYMFGWGLINAESAAGFLVASVDSSATTHVFEASLESDQSISFDIDKPEGEFFRATLVWTDPPANPALPVLNDRTPRLVNDLNLSASDGNDILLPWVLDPENPSVDASRGVNRVDNVEQIVDESMQSGRYTVTVTASELSSGRQDFSLLIGTPPTGTVIRTYAISGRIDLSGEGLNRIPVELTGAAFKTTQTTPDGIYTFTGLPPGAYEVVPGSTHVTFPVPSRTIQISASDVRADFSAESGLSFLEYSLFSGPNLLHGNELEESSRTQTLSAGGVYGCTLVFGGETGSIGRGKVLFDFEFDSFVTNYIGLRADRFLRLSPEWTVTDTGSGRLSKRIPLLWVDSDTPLGHTATIPFRVEAEDEQLVLLDTLRIPVSHPDDIPPGIFLEPGVRGPVSDGVGIGVSLLDGSGLVNPVALFLDRNNPESVLQEVPLFDDGDLAENRDFTAGDAIFSARYLPSANKDFRLAVSVEDSKGNSALRLTDKYLTSRPFERTSDVLLLSDSESISETDTHLAALRRAGIDADYWETLVRGRIDTGVLLSYPVVIRSLHRNASPGPDDLDELATLAGTGKAVLVLGESLQNGDSKLRSLLHLSGSDVNSQILNISGYPGVDASAGFVASLRPGSMSLPLNSTGSIQPLLRDADRPERRAAFSFSEGSTRIVVSSVTAASTSSADAATELLQRLLFAATKDLKFVPEPAPVLDLLPDDRSEIVGNIVSLSWAPAEFATYDLEVDTDSTFSSPGNRTQRLTPTGTFSVQPDTRYFWHVRTRNPRGSGSWSATRSFRTVTPNAAPVVSQPIEDISTGEGRAEIQISLTNRFTDPDGDVLAFSLTNTDPQVVSPTLQNAEISIVPLRAGTSEIRVSASDPAGATAEISFTVTVSANHAPVGVVEVPAVSLVLEFETLRMGLDSLFFDSDGDLLTFTTNVQNTDIVIADVPDRILRLTPMSPGATTVNILASDGRGLKGALSFDVTVSRNRPPEVDNPARDFEMLTGQDSVWIDLTSLFTDPDGERLSYGVESTNPQVVDASLVQDADLLLESGALGSATIIVTARDRFDASTSDTIHVSVRMSLSANRIDEEVPDLLTLEAPFPNPISESMSIRLAIPRVMVIRLDVYSILGKRVAHLLSGTLDPGTHLIRWVPENLAGGVYFVTLLGDQRALTRRIVIVHPAR